MKTIESIVEGILLILFLIGEVWVFAWVFNPDINSNTVWFIAILWASLMAGITHTRATK